MKLITRKQLGWPASAAPLQTGQVGVKIHYEGTPVPKVAHSKCAGRWTAIRNSHLANPTENYSDVAYNYAVCQHGYVLEGRGVGRRTGANGNQELNRRHYAVLVMIGSSGDTQPSAAAVTAVREVIAYLRDHGAGNEIKGHRDGYATSCPGDALYALVKSGALNPSKTAPKPAPPKEEEDVALTPAEIDQIVEKTWAYRLVSPTAPAGTDPTRKAGTMLRWSDQNTADILAAIAALSAKVTELESKLK